MTPIRPSATAEYLPDRHAFAEKTRGQDGGPDWHREFDRDDLSQWDQGQREEPAELRRIVNEIAASHAVTAATSFSGREASGTADQRVQHHQGEDRSRSSMTGIH